MLIYKFLESEPDPRCYYDERCTLWDVLLRDITTPGVYQIRRSYVRKNQNDLCPSLCAHNGTGGNNVPLVLDRGRIRKLTPRECFRLQGFSDFDSKLSNGRQYVQSGNTITVNVLETIFSEVLR